MKNKRILSFLTTHFTLIQTSICLIYLIGWKLIANLIWNDFIETNDYTFDLTVIFLELVYILIMLENIFYLKNENKQLKKRSQTVIQDYLQSAKHDVFISGIINNSVINIFMNNRALIDDCIQRKIKIHILFYIADNEQCFDWYLKMMYGFNNYKDKIQYDKSLYNTNLKLMNTYEVFKILLDKKLLEIKRINSPITTAFVAKDVNIDSKTDGQIQCLFYQFKVDSPDCPTYIIDYNEEMFPVMKKVILDTWESSIDDLNVSYTDNN